MLQIINKYLDRMVERFKYGSSLLQGVCSLLLLSITTIGGVMTLEEIEEATEGKGVFSVAVTNTGDQGAIFGVSVSMSKVPQGCGHLTIGTTYSFTVGAKETEIMELPVPFISTQEDKDIDQYNNVNNRLPLAEDSKIFIEVKRVFGEPCYKRKVFKAKYLAGTRLIELPQRISISINCYEDQALYRSYYPKLRWLENQTESLEKLEYIDEVDEDTKAINKLIMELSQDTVPK
jgi:hypothetical protein